MNSYGAPAAGTTLADMQRELARASAMQILADLNGWDTNNYDLIERLNRDIERREPDADQNELDGWMVELHRAEKQYEALASDARRRNANPSGSLADRMRNHEAQSELEMARDAAAAKRKEIMKASVAPSTPVPSSSRSAHRKATPKPISSSGRQVREGDLGVPSVNKGRFAETKRGESTMSLGNNIPW